MKPSMKRKKDGLILPYSEELVATHPGEFLALKYDAKTRKFVEGQPLLPKPKAAPIDDDAVVFVDDGRETPAPAPYVDPEPDTSDEGGDGEEEAKPPAGADKDAAEEAKPKETETEDKAAEEVESKETPPEETASEEAAPKAAPKKKGRK